jgi:hypothetical protein
MTEFNKWEKEKHDEMSTLLKNYSDMINKLKNSVKLPYKIGGTRIHRTQRKQRTQKRKQRKQRKQRKSVRKQ